MAKGKISARQKDILDFIKSEILSKGFPPSVREICDAVNLKSTSSVHAHLETLEKYGYIKRDPTKPRTIEILDDDFQKLRFHMTNIPILSNHIVSGIALLSETNITGSFPLPTEYAPEGDCFVINAPDNSLSGKGILKGNLVFVQATGIAKEGDIIVILKDNKLEIAEYNSKTHAGIELTGKVFANLQLFK